MKVLAAQLCPTLCDTMGYSLPGSSVHGTLQAKILVCPKLKLMGLFVSFLFVCFSYKFFYFLIHLLEYSQLTNDVVVVLGEQQRDSAIHIFIC